MKAKLSALWARWRAGGWVILAALSAVAVVVWRLVTLKHGTLQGPNAEPVVPPELASRVAKAEEDALVARVQATTTATEHMTELATIQTIDDGAERRRRLAAMLKTLK